MRPAAVIPVLLSSLCLIGVFDPASGSCPFPSSYTGRFWFRMYVEYYTSYWVYREYTPDAVIYNRNDNHTHFLEPTRCQDLEVVPPDSSRLFYITVGSLKRICAKSVISSDWSAILLQEVYVNASYTAATQCHSLFTEACLTSSSCSAVWMPLVNQLSIPPAFGSTQCPFQGAFQLSASYSSASNDCYGVPNSIVLSSGSSLQFSLCSQSSLRSTTFKNRTLLQDSVTCMQQMSAGELNTDEVNWNVILLQDGNVLYCARYSVDSSGNIQMSINVQSSYLSAYCGGATFSTSGTSNVLLLNIIKTLPTSGPPVITSATTMPTTIDPTTLPSAFAVPVIATPSSTLLPISSTITTSTSSFPPTPSTTTASTSSSLPTPSTATSSATCVPTTTSTTSASSIPTPTPSVSTLAVTTSSSLPSSVTTVITTVPYISSGSNPSPSTYTTVAGTGNATNGTGNSGLDNCPQNSCGKGAVCNAMTHNCECRALFYAYQSNASRCVQDNKAIDDTFLKILVPIIVISGVGSLIAALVLCLVPSPISANLAETSAAAAMVTTRVVTTPAAADDQLFVGYANNDAYAHTGVVDRRLVTYGGQSNPSPASVTPNNYIMVGSSIPKKM